ncbi:uncharacterized protein LOC123565053 isoform X2 [Mercenaria mercenaria]|uniref:uncharacterized protein LOC123565053 isoform X2 n=1 Tax=Mercenaria mercenaria TaxID=6596 RepID=UPI001E1D779C|nr:uncharacterized protein LOC123565053 isoform X2 [Mercenaria mercenaria]
MKTRKRGRSPNQECDDCLPISKRITRLNIQASRHSIDKKESLTEIPQPGSSNGSVPVSPEVQLPWQHCCQRGPYQGNNNNLNYLPCGSSQCDTVQGLSTTKNGLQEYAVHHGIPKEDFNGYKPELTQTENPHYYQINSVLYRAHLEKASRQGMQLKE